MKRYIKFSKDMQSLPIIEEIHIEVFADVTSYIESADLIHQGQLSDSQVVEEWKNFMTTVRTYISNHNELELVYEQPGKPLRLDSSVPGSYYYYIGVKSPDGEFVGKIVVDFRLSTHVSTDTSGKDTEKHEKVALKEIKKKYPVVEDIVPESKVVNKKEFKNYVDAKRAIVGVLQRIINTYSKDL